MTQFETSSDSENPLFNWHEDMISASSIILPCASIAGISANIISHRLVTMASSDVARQSCPVSSRCLALVPSPAAWGLWCLWLGRCRGRTADDLPALQHAASDPGQSEPRSRTLQPIRDQFTCSARISAALRPHAALSPWTAPPPGFALFRALEISKQRTFSANHLNWRHSLALRVLPCLELCK